VDSLIQVQLGEDGGGSTRQATDHLSPSSSMFHRERQGISKACQDSV